MCAGRIGRPLPLAGGDQRRPCKRLKTSGPRSTRLVMCAGRIGRPLPLAGGD